MLFFLLKIHFFISLVDDECYPYSAEASRCKIRRTDTLSSAGCKLPQKVPRDHMYRVGPAYSLNNESDIMAEIYESGPVQGMRVQFFVSNSFRIEIDAFVL